MHFRAHWADDTLKKRDGEGRHASLFQGEEADEDYDMPLDEAEAFYEGWTEREKAWYQEAKEDEQQAWLQMQGAKRTLKEARARQHEVKMTRKFYRSYPIGSGGRAGGQKGDREKGPCFRCGERGHHKHECPKRESAKLATLQEEEDDEAQFTYHTMDIQDTPEETDGDQSNEGEVNYYGATGSSELEPDFIFRATLSTEKAITEGKAVIDGGATRTMASVYAIEKYMEVMKGLHGTDGIKHVGVTEADRPTFGFGNSQKAKCLSTCVLKLPHEERPMQLRVHVVDEGKAPVLLSVDTLRKMGAIIDFATDEVIFSKIAPDKMIKLERSTSGHQLLPLTSDFIQRGELLKRSVSRFEAASGRPFFREASKHPRIGKQTLLGEAWIRVGGAKTNRQLERRSLTSL